MRLSPAVHSVFLKPGVCRAFFSTFMAVNQARPSTSLSNATRGLATAAR